MFEHTNIANRKHAGLRTCPVNARQTGLLSCVFFTESSNIANSSSKTAVMSFKPSLCVFKECSLAKSPIVSSVPSLEPEKFLFCCCYID